MNIKILFIFCLSFLFSITSFAQNLSLIRDTEIEGVLLSYVQKLFKAADLPVQKAKVVLVNDQDLNAFVVGGHTIFIHSGLITQSQNVDDLIFVLAHETGHIVGGHVTRGIEAYEKAQTTALISTILGGLVAVAGRPDAGIAVMMGGSNSAGALYTSFRQTDESAADRIAADIMKKTNYSMGGFLNTMKLIRMQDRLTPVSEWNYLRTHPLTQERVNALERFTQNPLPFKKDIRFELIKAKLIGFLYPPQRVFDIYQNHNTLPALYAKAIAYYRNRELDKSLSLLDTLIKSKPDFAYFYELKAQFLFETSHIKEAIQYYTKALKYIKNAPLIRLSLSQALLQTEEKSNSVLAINELKQVLNSDSEIPFAWQLLATAYDRTNQKALRDYAMAELYRTKKDYKNAEKMAQKALKQLKKGTLEYNKADDIIALSKKEDSAIQVK